MFSSWQRNSMYYHPLNHNNNNLSQFNCRHAMIKYIHAIISIQKGTLYMKDIIALVYKCFQIQIHILCTYTISTFTVSLYIKSLTQVIIHFNLDRFVINTFYLSTEIINNNFICMRENYNKYSQTRMVFVLFIFLNTLELYGNELILTNKQHLASPTNCHFLQHLLRPHRLIHFPMAAKKKKFTTK